MNNLTTLNPAQPPASKAPSKKRRLLAWTLIGLGLKLAIAAVVFVVAANHAPANARQFTPPDIVK